MIKSIYIKNFKLFEEFGLECNPGLNIVVGNNEAGKSTLLEAIHLALAKRINGRPAELELSPYLFNARCVDGYRAALKAGGRPEPPRIIIELEFDDIPELADMRGSNNHANVDAVGLRLEIGLDDDEGARDEYARLVESGEEITTVPTEYYKVFWYSFADKHISARGLKVRASHIDAATIRFQTGASYYLNAAIEESLPRKDQAALKWEYRRLKELFSEQPAISAINDALRERHSSLNNRRLSVGVDMSQRAPWEANLTPYLDETPFHMAGKGEQQALKIMFAMDRQADDCQVILIEEPENHLAFGHMNILLDRIAKKRGDRQVFITTHSAFVLNKLGLESTVLLREGKAAFLSGLPADTEAYFRKLPGYDTLRLILAKRTILVEGPSDELFVQTLYRQKHGKQPIADGVDVLSVRGLSFPRFLDIAKAVGHPTVVITDNDRNYQRNVTERYSPYDGIPTIMICADPDHARPTLEYHVLASCGRETLNAVFGTKHSTDETLLAYMLDHKTDWALKAFDTNIPLGVPPYLLPALAK
jgi:putative ATP-dependent endonuclease of OLD family